MTDILTQPSVGFSPQEDRIILAASALPDYLMKQFSGFDVSLRRIHLKDQPDPKGFYFYFNRINTANTISVFISDEEILVSYTESNDDVRIQDTALYSILQTLIISKAKEAGIN